MHHLVNPATSFNVVKTSYDDLKIGKEVFTEFLDVICVMGNFDAWTSFHNKLSSYFCLVAFYVLLPE